MSSERVHVKIGEAKVIAHEGVLFTIGLGSCVAVVLYDPKEKVAGLAHVMLPETNNLVTATAARFAPTAIPLLVDMMVAGGARERGVYARIVGGASMFAEMQPPPGSRLGDRNVSAVKEALAKASIPLQGEDTGGTYGRSVFLDAHDGSLLIRAVRRADVVL